MEVDEPLARSLEHIRSQAAQMRKCLSTPGQLMVALKHASLMVGELRSNEFSPKEYYELYIACLDALIQLQSYLVEDHQNHHLADIYEMVQFTGNLLPRLYLMITVGSAFLATPDAPKFDVIKDMLEMCRGVQNPLRGLFLRYFLGQQTRGSLPTGTGGSEGSLADSIQFIITNFVEMNKLWVRLQHVGPLREREKRFEERCDLQLIVGSNILRLAELDGVDANVFDERVLPLLLEQVVQCRDWLAQEYLLDVITQAFPAEFHFDTLSKYLSVIQKLSPQASRRKVLLASIGRVIQFAEESLQGEDQKAQKAVNSEQEIEDTKKSLDSSQQEAEKPSTSLEDETNKAPSSANSQKSLKPSESEDTKPSEYSEHEQEQEQDQESQKPSTPPNQEAKHEDGQSLKENSSPDKNEPANSGSSKNDGRSRLIAILQSAVRDYWYFIRDLTLNVADRAAVATKLAELEHIATGSVNLDTYFEYVSKEDGGAESAEFLMSLFERTKPTLVLENPHFRSLLAVQSSNTKHLVAEKVLEKILSGTSTINDLEVAQQIFGLFGLIIKSGGVDPMRMSELVHLVDGSNLEETLKLLQLAHRMLREGGVDTIRQTYGGLVMATLQALRVHSKDPAREALKFVNKTIHDLATVGDLPLAALKLYVFAGSCTDVLGHQAAAYEFFVQAFTVYEEQVSDSRAQFTSLCIIIGALQKSRAFSPENYETLALRCISYAQKLLRKQDQCHTILLSAHLWLPTYSEYENSTKVFETLQRALRVADSCMDSGISCQLFVDALDRFCFFYDREVTSITSEDISRLIELIQSQLENSDEADVKFAKSQFKRTIEYLSSQKSDRLASLNLG